MSEFFSYFFTHLAQYYNTQQGVENWIKPVLPVGFFRPETQEQNNLYFFASKQQPSGEISIDLLKGDTVLDVSSTVKIDRSELTADRTRQPVSNYNATLQTPLINPYLKDSYHLDFNNVTVTHSYPTSRYIQVPEGRYPYQTLRTELYVNNPVLVEAVSYRQQLTQGDELLYELVTADNTEIKISDTTVPGDVYNSPLTADRVGYYREAPEGATVLDLSSPEDSDRRVLVIGIPDGDVTASWTVGDQIVSKTYFPSSQRGYLPADRLSENMIGATLTEISLALLTLIDKQDNLLLLSAVKELCFIWSDVLGNVKDGVLQTEVLPGMPTFLPRLIPTVRPLDPERSTLHQSWLGYVLTKCVYYLQQTEDYETFLPQWLPEMMHQLALVVSNAVDLTTGATYVGFDQYGYLIDQVDLPSTVMAQLFLQEYLALHYDLKVHQAAARAYTRLLSVKRTDITDSTPENFAPVYKLFWNIAQGRHRDTDELVEDTVDVPLSDFMIGLWKWSLLQLPEYVNINYEPLEYTYTQLTNDLYERSVASGVTSGKVPSLVCSAWQYLLNKERERTLILTEAGEFELTPDDLLLFTSPETSSILYPDREFYLAAEDARAFEQAMFLEAKRMLPYGYQWFSDEAKQYGSIAAILLAIAQLSFRWYLAYSVFWRGRYLSLAQGIALVHWAQSLGVKVRPLQPDSLLRSRCLPLISSDRSTLAALEQTAQRHSVDLKIIEPQPESLVINGDTYQWNELTPEQIDELADNQVIRVIRDLYPIDKRLINLYDDTLWENVCPSVVLYTKQVRPDFTKEIQEGLASSVALKIYATFVREDTVRSFGLSNLNRVIT